jgi:hypothetical protein
LNHRGTTTRRFGARLAGCLLVLTVALGGCIAGPEGASWTEFTTSLPLHIPFIGDENAAVECGSACTSEEDHDSDCDDYECDETLPDDATNAITEPSTYERLVNGAIVEPASTVVMSTFSFAGTAFGTVANYCVPEGTIGPPETMPPGRFHPVPTRPVFARRD